jgi:hypothetical protein
MNDFKPIEINDRNVFAEFLSVDPPVTSELTFTNLFMWRHRYHPVWRVSEDCLLIVLQPEDEPPFGLQPVGQGIKEAALDLLCADIQKMSPEGKICRADRNFVQDHVDHEKYLIEEDRDNSDYVYLTENLIKLPGKRYHGKKNHVNKFVKNNEFEYRAFDQDLVKGVLDLQEAWCQLRECTLNPGLYQEDIAIQEAISHFPDLGFKGGAILIDSKVEAFSFGEMLNPETAVIHIEKANPAIPGLYAAINQIFCENTWSEVKYVNREQDLGVEGLRKAKLSYYPDHMVDKFTIISK